MQVTTPAPIPTGLLYSRHQRFAASRLLLSPPTFHLIAHLFTALTTSPPDPSHTPLAISLVVDLAAHIKARTGYKDCDPACPTLLITLLQRPLLPLLLPREPDLAYQWCQQLLSHLSHLPPDLPEDLSFIPTLTPVLRRMSYGRRPRRWLTLLMRDELRRGGRPTITCRVLLAHAWFTHGGHLQAIRLYHQALHLLQARGDAQGKRLRADLHLFISLCLLHRGQSTSSRLKPNQRMNQPSQVVRALAYLAVYYRMHDGRGGESDWNVGRWYQTAGMAQQARIHYQRILTHAGRAVVEKKKGKGKEEEESKVDYSRRAAEALALLYKRSGNEELAQRLYEEFCS